MTEASRPRVKSRHSDQKNKVAIGQPYFFSLNYKISAYCVWSRTKGEGPGIISEARPADDEARRLWRSGQNCSALQAEKQFWEPQEVAMGSSSRLPPRSNKNPFTNVGGFLFVLFIIHYSFFQSGFLMNNE